MHEAIFSVDVNCMNITQKYVPVGIMSHNITKVSVEMAALWKWSIKAHEDSGIISIYSQHN